MPKLSESEKPDSAYNSSIDSEDEAEVEKQSGGEDVASPKKGDAAIAAAEATGACKTKIAGLYKPPTHDELQTLKETESLFQSNLMRLQVRTRAVIQFTPPSPPPPPPRTLHVIEGCSVILGRPAAMFFESSFFYIVNIQQQNRLQKKTWLPTFPGCHCIPLLREPVRCDSKKD